MNRRIQQALPLLILLGLAGMTVWLERATRIDDHPSSGARRHDPDAIIDNFTLRRFDENGHVQHTLTARQMRHYPDDDSSELIAPHLRYSGKLAPTHISADRATLTKDGKEAILRDNVRVLREARADSPEMTLTTNALNVFPDEELARTDQPVRITQGNSVATGVGLTANRIKEQYTLESRVNATIDRARRP